MDEKMIARYMRETQETVARILTNLDAIPDLFFGQHPVLLDLTRHLHAARRSAERVENNALARSRISEDRSNG